MQDVNQALSTLKRDASTERTTPMLSSGAVGELFAQLKRQLGVKLADQFMGQKIEDVQQTWATHLGGFRREELLRGLAETAKRKFPPTLGEFAVMCRPALDPETAWYEAEMGLRDRETGARGEWTHPAIWRAASTMARQIQSGEFSQYRGRWKALLARELARGWQKDVPTPAPMLGMTNLKPRAPTNEEFQRMRDLVERARQEAMDRQVKDMGK